METLKVGAREALGTLWDRVCFGERPNLQSRVESLDDLSAHINYDDEAVKQRLGEGKCIDEKLARASDKLLGFFSGNEGATFQFSIERTLNEVGLRIREVGWGTVVFGFRRGKRPTPILDFATEPSGGSSLPKASEHLKEMKGLSRNKQTSVIREATTLCWDVWRDVHWEVRAENEKENSDRA